MLAVRQDHGLPQRSQPEDDGQVGQESSAYPVKEYNGQA